MTNEEIDIIIQENRRDEQIEFIKSITNKEERDNACIDFMLRLNLDSINALRKIAISKHSYRSDKINEVESYVLLLLSLHTMYAEVMDIKGWD